MKVRYSLRALTELQIIFAQIYSDNPRAAIKVRASIRKTANLISRDPKRGHKTSRSGVLRVPVVRYPYAIYFRARDEVVQIVHIRHSARHWPKAGEL